MQRMRWRRGLPVNSVATTADSQSGFHTRAGHCPVGAGRNAVRGHRMPDKRVPVDANNNDRRTNPTALLFALLRVSPT